MRSGPVQADFTMRRNGGDLSALGTCTRQNPRLMQGHQSVFDQFQFFLGGDGITHLEAVGGSVIGMLETVPGVHA